ncbi:MAG: hypothetical protein ABJN36_17870 [Cyclobacteriaceae bacterium]
MNILLKISAFVIVMFAFVAPLIAQPSAPPATPIDGGLSLLLAAGGLYGLKKLRDNKKA